MGRFQVFEHTADLGLEIEGRTLNDLFETAGRGLFSLMVVNLDEVRPELEEQITLEAPALDELLVRWLNELILHEETSHRIYSRFSVVVDSFGKRLDARVAGEPLDPLRHVVDHEVKAATWHQLVVEQGPVDWRARVLLDI